MSHKSYRKGGTKITCLILVIVFLLFLLFIVIMTASYFLLRKTHTIPSTDAVLIEEAVTQSMRYGTIEGSLGYPSDYIPPMGICAHNKKTKEEFCTHEMIQSTTYMYGVGYAIKAPAGEYNVYAFVTEDEDGVPLVDEDYYKAYYSEYVTCPPEADTCESHKPITVTVKEDQKTKNINPQDWYVDL